MSEHRCVQYISGLFYFYHNIICNNKGYTTDNHKILKKYKIFELYINQV